MVAELTGYETNIAPPPALDFQSAGTLSLSLRGIIILLK